MDAPLTVLTRLFTPATTPVSKDWPTIEERLGSPLPPDYKELVATFGGGRFDGHLWLLEPDCGKELYDLVFDNQGRMEDLEDFWDMGEEKPAELEEEGSRLISWGGTDNGDVLYWLVRPGTRPDAWTVMVNESRGPRWEHFDLTCTDFLASVLSGEVRSGILGSRLPAAEHEFRPYGSF